MKKTLILSIALAVSPLSSRASSVLVSDFSGTTLSNPVTFENGTSLNNAGHLVRIGYFNTSAQSATWLTDLRSNDVTKINSSLQSFIPLGENAANTNLGDVPAAGAGPRIQARPINGTTQPGRLAGGVLNVNPTTSAQPNTVSANGVPAGSRIFILVYSDLNSTLNFGEQFGVFSADNWLMPSDPSLPLGLNTTDIDGAPEVFRGTFGSLKMAAIVPEPGTTVMALFAGLGLMARRRR